MITDRSHSLWKCAYCGQKVSLEELTHVDFELTQLSDEDLEDLYDALPSIDDHRGSPYIHMHKAGFPIQNLCFRCYTMAYYRAGLPK